MTDTRREGLNHKIVGIDWGRKYIGVAVSDDSQTMAFPREVVARADIERFLVELYKKEAFTTMVMGSPKELDGSDSAYAQSIRDEASKLVEAITRAHDTEQISLVFLDERFTSRHVAGGQDKKLHQHRTARNEGFAKTGERKDAQAAALILQRYLDQQKQK